MVVTEYLNAFTSLVSQSLSVDGEKELAEGKASVAILDSNPRPKTPITRPHLIPVNDLNKEIGVILGDIGPATLTECYVGLTTARKRSVRLIGYARLNISQGNPKLTNVGIIHHVNNHRGVRCIKVCADRRCLYSTSRKSSAYEIPFQFTRGGVGRNLNSPLSLGRERKPSRSKSINAVWGCLVAN